MKWYFKFLIILAAGFGFYLLSGDGSGALLLMSLLGYLEWKTQK